MHICCLVLEQPVQLCEARVALLDALEGLVVSDGQVISTGKRGVYVLMLLGALEGLVSDGQVVDTSGTNTVLTT